MNSKDTLEALYQELATYKDFEKDPENCERFLKVIDQVISLSDSESIPVIFKYFDDSSEYTWVMESLMIALENYKITDLLNELSRDPKFYWKTSSLRTRGLIYGILNSPKDFSELKKFIYKFKLSDPFVEMLFQAIKFSTSPHHAELIQELKKELAK